MSKPTIAGWTIPSSDLPVLYQPLQPQGVTTMQDTAISKTLGIKFVGSTRPTETVIIPPGATTRDLLKQLGLGPGFQLGDARNPDILFPLDDPLFARVRDGDLLHVSATVDAGV